MRSSVLGSLVTVSQVFAAAAVVPTVTLNNGVEMPMMLYGTGYNILKPDEAEIDVRQALQNGFPGLDTAQSYGNSVGVGRAVAEVERSRVFVNTKIGGDFGYYHIDTAYNESMRQAYKNLEELSMDYVDMVILHNPPLRDTENNCTVMQMQWKALEDFYTAGKARAIGVSNYCQVDLACILETASVTPAINQLLFHVGMGPDPRGVVSSNRALGIHVMAYQPMGAWNYDLGRKDHSLITGNFTGDIGRQYNKTGGQVALRWLAQHGVSFATSSRSDQHLQEDLQVFEFTLDDADMQQLDGATGPYNEPNDELNGFGDDWHIPKLCGPIPSIITV